MVDMVELTQRGAEFRKIPENLRTHPYFALNESYSQAWTLQAREDAWNNGIHLGKALRIGLNRRKNSGSKSSEANRRPKHQQLSLTCTTGGLDQI
jgi:hypothetical protein